MKNVAAGSTYWNRFDFILWERQPQDGLKLQFLYFAL
jgi:hypothetical protein